MHAKGQVMWEITGIYQKSREGTWCLNNNATHFQTVPNWRAFSTLLPTLLLSRLHTPAKSPTPYRGQFWVRSRLRVLLKFFHILTCSSDEAISHYKRYRRKQETSVNKVIFKQMGSCVYKSHDSSLLMNVCLCSRHTQKIARSWKDWRHSMQHLCIKKCPKQLDLCLYILLNM